jgi:hypothetical protein
LSSLVKYYELRKRYKCQETERASNGLHPFQKSTLSMIVAFMLYVLLVKFFISVVCLLFFDWQQFTKNRIGFLFFDGWTNRKDFHKMKRQMTWQLTVLPSSLNLTEKFCQYDCVELKRNSLRSTSSSSPHFILSHFCCELVIG